MLSNCTHAAVAILYPFTWQHVFIPVVPETLLNYASAPMPFIIGILANHVPKLDKLPTEGVIRVDLDAGTLACPYSDPIPPLTDPKEGKEGLKILGAGASAGAWALGTLSANLGSLEKSTGVSLVSVVFPLIFPLRGKVCSFTLTPSLPFSRRMSSSMCREESRSWFLVHTAREWRQ